LSSLSANGCRFYLQTEFIIYPKSSSSKPKTMGKSRDVSLPDLSLLGTFTPDITSGNSTPPTILEETKQSALRSRPPRKDGGVVCCLAISEYCFKMGRVTVPPVSVLVTALFDRSADGSPAHRNAARYAIIRSGETKASSGDPVERRRSREELVAGRMEG